MALHSVWALRPCHAPVSRARNGQNTNSFNSSQQNDYDLEEGESDCVNSSQVMQTTKSNQFQRADIRKCKGKVDAQESHIKSWLVTKMTWLSKSFSPTPVMITTYHQ